MPGVELREIRTAAEREALLGLRLGPGQNRYLDTMEEIFQEAAEEQRAMPHPWAVHDAATLDAVIAYVRTRPGAEVLYTSCRDGEGSPRGLYLRYGFVDTGRVMWGENLLAYDLARST